MNRSKTQCFSNSTLHYFQAVRFFAKKRQNACLLMELNLAMYTARLLRFCDDEQSNLKKSSALIEMSCSNRLKSFSTWIILFYTLNFTSKIVAKRKGTIWWQKMTVNVNISLKNSSHNIFIRTIMQKIDFHDFHDFWLLVTV